MIFVGLLKKILIVFYIVNLINVTQIKHRLFHFFQSAHISKRSIHVQWVSRIARQIGKGLNLNLDLIEAAALGHDLGHAPYGHVGERALNEKLQEKGFG